MFGVSKAWLLLSVLAQIPLAAKLTFCCCWLTSPCHLPFPVAASPRKLHHLNRPLLLVSLSKHSCPLFLHFSLSHLHAQKLTAWIQSCSRQGRMTTLHFKSHVCPCSKPCSTTVSVWSTQLLCLFLGLIWSQGRPIVARWILKSCLCWPVLGHLYTRWAPYLYTLGRGGNILDLEEKVLMVQDALLKKY